MSSLCSRFLLDYFFAIVVVSSFSLFLHIYSYLLTSLESSRSCLLLEKLNGMSHSNGIKVYAYHTKRCSRFVLNSLFFSIERVQSARPSDVLLQYDKREYLALTIQQQERRKQGLGAYEGFHFDRVQVSRFLREREHCGARCCGKEENKEHTEDNI